VNPRDAYPIALANVVHLSADRCNATNHLVAGNQRVSRRSNASFHDIEVSPTHSAD
jgi:hypothetical protein